MCLLTKTTTKENIMEIFVKSIEQDYQNETTCVWVEYQGDTIAICESDLRRFVLDDEGYPMDDEDLTEELNPVFDLIADEYNGEDCPINETFTV